MQRKNSIWQATTSTTTTWHQHQFQKFANAVKMSGNSSSKNPSSFSLFCLTSKEWVETFFHTTAFRSVFSLHFSPLTPFLPNGRRANGIKYSKEERESKSFKEEKCQCGNSVSPSNSGSNSDLPNKRTSTIAEFWWLNLDPCLVNIFDQWKWFQLIDLIPGFTSYRGPGIKLINWNHFYWSKIFTKHGSRFCSENSAIVPVRLLGRLE